jgi:hypothetical protein
MNEPPDRPNKTYHGVCFGLSIALLALASVLQVRVDGRVVVPPFGFPLPETCYFKQLFGLGCPGCGLTRCFISLAHGEFRRAWSFNPAGLLVFLVVLIQIPYRALQVWRAHKNLDEWQLASVSIVIGCLLVVALIAQWVWRCLIGFGV